MDALPAVTAVADPGYAHYREVLRSRYADDPNWVYPDVGLLKNLLSGKAAYLRHGAARAFAVERDGRATGFAVAFVDPRMQSKVGRAVGALGFLEWLDPEALEELTGAAAAWLRERGVTEAWAPFNANGFLGAGLREDRFDEPPFTGCAHHPPGASEDLRAAGFGIVNRYLDFSVDLTSDAWRGFPDRAEGVSFRNVERRRFADEIRTFVRLHNAAFEDVWGEGPVSDEEGLELLGPAKLAVIPSLWQLAVVDGRDAGFVVCLPDFNEVLAPQRRPVTSPSGVAKIALRRRRIRTVGLFAVGVDPSLHGRGIGTALVARACRAAADLGYRRLEYALVAEDNRASQSTIARFGGELHRTFGVYAKTI
jgi:GNAT superfamily N-acetyltransferase